MNRYLGRWAPIPQEAVPIAPKKGTGKGRLRAAGSASARSAKGRRSPPQRGGRAPKGGRVSKGRRPPQRHTGPRLSKQARRQAELVRQKRQRLLAVVGSVAGVALLVGLVILLRPEPTEPDVILAMTADNFSFAPGTITVSEGDLVRLEITNREGTHRFTIDELGIDKGLSKTKTTVVEFNASTSGTFAFYCPVGNHRAQGMEGSLEVA